MQGCVLPIHHISHIRKFLTSLAAKAVVHSLASSRHILLKNSGDNLQGPPWPCPQIHCQPTHSIPLARNLRSATKQLISITWYNTQTYGAWALSRLTPCAYKIPLSITMSPTLICFKLHLKTHYLHFHLRYCLESVVLFFVLYFSLFSLFRHLYSAAPGSLYKCTLSLLIVLLLSLLVLSLLSSLLLSLFYTYFETRLAETTLKVEVIQLCK